MVTGNTSKEPPNLSPPFPEGALCLGPWEGAQAGVKAPHFFPQKKPNGNQAGLCGWVQQSRTKGQKPVPGPPAPPGH